MFKENNNNNTRLPRVLFFAQKAIRTAGKDLLSLSCLHLIPVLKARALNHSRHSKWPSLSLIVRSGSNTIPKHILNNTCLQVRLTRQYRISIVLK